MMDTAIWRLLEFGRMGETLRGTGGGVGNVDEKGQTKSNGVSRRRHRSTERLKEEDGRCP